MSDTMSDAVLGNLEQYDAVSEIIPGLFLSSISPVYDATTLRRHSIKAVLSVLSDEPDFEHLLDVDYHFLEIDDAENSDLLSSFEMTNQLIAKWRKEGRNVLVHCFLGVSRSSTIVTAYLMEHLKLTSAEAIDLVHQKRSVARPNAGFSEQLAIFGQLNYELNVDNVWYRRYLFGRIVLNMADNLKNLTIGKAMARRFMPTGTTRQQIRQLTEVDDDEDGQRSYQCKNCHHLLFTDRAALHSDSLNIFVHILPWMADQFKYYLRFGQIHCPNCGRKLGRFKWVPPFLSMAHFKYGCDSATHELKVPMVFALTKSAVDSAAR